MNWQDMWTSAKTIRGLREATGVFDLMRLEDDGGPVREMPIVVIPLFDGEMNIRVM